MSTGLVKDRAVSVGPGCTVTLGHAFGCGAAQAAPEALAFWFYGWRENLDASAVEELAERYPYCQPSAWESKPEATEKVISRLKDMLAEDPSQYLGLPAYDTVEARKAAIRAGDFGKDGIVFWTIYDFCGSPAMARELLGEDDFQRRVCAAVSEGAQ